MTIPPPLSKGDLKRRVARTRRIAKMVGFVGTVEYLHGYSRTGGAQYLQGIHATDDRLFVYAEAFDRDARDDFTLDAIIAHERGHQLAVRNPALSNRAVLS